MSRQILRPSGWQCRWCRELTLVTIRPSSFRRYTFSVETLMAIGQIETARSKAQPEALESGRFAPASLVQRVPVWPIVILIIAAGFRYWNLLGLPLFVDESLWLRWATN